MLKIKRFMLPLMLVGAFSFACDDDGTSTTGPTIADLAGTWNLVAPSTLDPDNPTIPGPIFLDQITSSTVLVIQADGDFTLTINLLGAPAPTVITGEFEITGNNTAEITNDADPGDPLNATFSLTDNDDTLNVEVVGAELIDLTQDGMIDADDAGDLDLTFERQ